MRRFLEELRLKATERRATVAAVGLAVVALLVLLSTLPLTSLGAQDARFAAVFSGDEEFIADGITRMITRPSLNYGFWWYPGFYMMTSATAALLLRLAGVPLATGAVLAPRIVAAFALAATVVATGLLAKQLSGRWRSAWLAAALVATTPAFFEYGITAHPDTLQLAMLSVSLCLLAMAAERATPSHLVAGSFAAGLAFATKYGGAFLVPVVAVVAALLPLRGGAARTAVASVRQALRSHLPRALLAFFAATVVGAPSFWFNLRAFAIGVSTHNRNVSFGYFERETAPGWHWLEMLADGGLVGRTWLWLSLLALLVVAWLLFSKRHARVRDVGAGAALRSERRLGYAVVLLYIVLYLAFLMLHSRMFEPRYLYPVVPALLALTTAALTDDALVNRARLLASMTVAGLALALLLVLPPRLELAAAVVRERALRPSHPCAEVGRWLKDQVDLQAPIAYDHYTYVPAEFQNVVPSWAMTDAIAAQIDARIVITTARIRDRFNASVNPDLWRYGREQFEASFAFYAAVESGRLPAYALAAQFPDCHGTRIYRRGVVPLEAR